MLTCYKKDSSYINHSSFVRAGLGVNNPFKVPTNPLFSFSKSNSAVKCGSTSDTTCLT